MPIMRGSAARPKQLDVLNTAAKRILLIIRFSMLNPRPGGVVLPARSCVSSRLVLRKIREGVTRKCEKGSSFGGFSAERLSSRSISNEFRRQSYALAKQNSDRIRAQISTTTPLTSDLLTCGLQTVSGKIRWIGR